MLSLRILVPLALVAAALAMSSSSEEFEPPADFDACLAQMDQKMEKHMKMKKGKVESMIKCAKECTPTEARKCVGFEEAVKECAADMAKLKKEYIEKKGKAKECLKTKCSKEPKFYGPCAMDVLHAYMTNEGKDVMKCAKPCMHGAMKKLHKELSPDSTAEEDETVEEEEGAEGKGKGGGKRGGKSGGKSGSRSHGKGKHGKGKKFGCLPMFCEPEALLECAIEAGLPEMKMKKELMHLNMVNKAQEGLKKGCDCLLKINKPEWLPTPLKAATCDNLLSPELCGKMKMSRHAERHRRFARSLYEMDFDEEM